MIRQKRPELAHLTAAKAFIVYLDRFRLEDRTAFVTGGARGIGYCVAEALAEAGARVTIGDRDGAEMAIACGRLAASGYAVDSVKLDVTNSGQVTRIADDLVARSGRIDILINNAGIARSDTPAEAVSDEQWLNVLDVNLNGSFWCARAFGRHMLARRSGSIVNVGSMSGIIVNRPQPQSYYNASKAALHQLTQEPGGRMGAKRRARQRRGADLHCDAAQCICRS